MENDTVLVLGGSGLVGSYLLPELESKYTSLYVSSHIARPKVGNQIKMDLSSPSLVIDGLKEIEPSVIVNLAAFTDVDGCEKDREHALQLNCNLPRLISDFAKSNHRRNDYVYVLHVSTDYIFDGEIGNYVEDSAPNPINWYGKTKLCGEQAITTNLDVNQWCIARVSSPFGIHPTKQSFPMYVYNKVSKGEAVHAVTDQYTSPTYSRDLGIVFNEIIQRRISGIINTASPTRLSRYEQGVKIAELFELDPGLILRASFESMSWLARRPRDSSLNVNKAQKLLRNKLREYDTSIRDFYLEIKSKGHHYKDMHSD